MKKLAVLLSSIVLATSVAGCAPKPAEVAAPTELNLYTWADYVPPAVIEDFTAKTGIKVNYDNFSENEEMYTKLQATNGGQYDVIICSDYIIDVMSKGGKYLETIDKTKLPNYKNIDANFQSKYYDKENLYSIPYAAGSAMLVYDTAKVETPITAYKDLWRPELKDSVVVLDDQRGMIGMAMLIHGESINETDPAKLEVAKEELIALKPNIIAYDSDKPHEMIINGTAKAGFMFGSQITAAMEAVDTITYAYPSEGMSFSIDNIVIPKGAPNSEAAYIFIDYLLDGQNSAKVSSIVNYINCNTAAKEFLPDAYLANKTVNIPSEELAKAQVYEDLGDKAAEYTKIWTEIKSN